MAHRHFCTRKLDVRKTLSELPKTDRHFVRINRRLVEKVRRLVFPIWDTISKTCLLQS